VKARAALLLFAASMLALDSAAEPDGGARVVIPPWVDEADLPAFDAEPFPPEKTPPPSPAEWKAAPRVHLTRRAQRAEACNAYRVREWIKIHCSTLISGMRLLAGSTDGIALWVTEPPTPGDVGAAGQFGELVFPVRPGDRRVFEVFGVEFEYEGWGTFPLLLVEEMWRTGAAKPEVALLSR
jgi:hypothetical protein